MKNLFTLILILSFNASARSETLENLARASNALLVMGDLILDEKGKTSKLTCQLELKHASPTSQKIRSLIDQKIKTLTQKDFQIIESRLGTCKNDCTCGTYAYAFENKDKKIYSEFFKIAEKINEQDRLVCYKSLKSFCSSPIYKSVTVRH